MDRKYRRHESTAVIVVSASEVLPVEMVSPYMTAFVTFPFSSMDLLSDQYLIFSLLFDIKTESSLGTCRHSSSIGTCVKAYSIIDKKTKRKQTIIQISIALI